MPDSTMARARSTIRPPPSSLTASAPASLTKRCAVAIACSSLASYEPNGRALIINRAPRAPAGWWWTTGSPSVVDAPLREKGRHLGVDVDDAVRALLHVHDARLVGLHLGPVVLPVGDDDHGVALVDQPRGGPVDLHL